MAYFYVKNSLGTRTTGGGLSKQTGSFTTLGATNVYATIAAAFTDGAGAGDYICLSDSHLETGSPATFSGGTGAVEYTMVLTVDDANCDVATTATSKQTAWTGVPGFTGRIYMQGVWLEYTLFLSDASNAMLIARDCVFECSSSATRILDLGGDGAHVSSINTEWKSAGSGYLTFGGGATFDMYGGKLTGCTYFTDLGGNSGGQHTHVRGADLSSITSYILGGFGSSPTTDDTSLYNFMGCKLNASLTGYVEETLENYNHRVALTNSSATSAGAEYQFYTEAYGGVVEDDTGIYRDSSTAFPSGQKISLKCVTDADATINSPFWFDFPTRYSTLSNTASDTITIHLISSTTLYDSDVWVDVVYADGTNKHTYNILSSRHNNLLDTNGTGLTTNTEAWTGRTSENRYQIDLDTSTDAGSDCYPIVRVYVAKGSETIYFDSEVVLSG